MGVRGRKAEAPGLHQGEGCDDRVMVREGGGRGGGVSLVTKQEFCIVLFQLVFVAFDFVCWC